MNCHKAWYFSCVNIKNINHIWLALVLFVFSAMLISAILILPFFYFAFLYSPQLFAGMRPIILLLMAVMISMVVATGISGLMGRRFVAPVTQISLATKEVAKGNFKVSIDEEYAIREVQDLAVNFNKMVRELNGIDTLRSDFITTVSHEFKTPLAAIEGYASLLRDRDLQPEEYEEYTRMIIESAAQLSALTGNILKISKLENQQIVCEQEQFFLDEQLRQSLLLLEKEWSRKEMQLNIDLAVVKYYGNQELLLQVWLNLLGNAIKFTPPGGSIGVRLTAEEKGVKVVISDSGIGMSEEVRSHIFEKFYQAEPSRNGQGNGLGLPLVKRIVDLC
ncbi:MAG: HAMP domain-containing sensor histidine kinase, partial [Clostridiales bacterium]